MKRNNNDEKEYLLKQINIARKLLLKYEAITNIYDEFTLTENEFMEELISPMDEYRYADDYEACYEMIFKIKDKLEELEKEYLKLK